MTRTTRFRALLVFCAMTVCHSCRSSQSILNDQTSDGIIRFGQSTAPCAGARIILDPRLEHRAVTIMNREVSTWDLKRGSMVSSWEANATHQAYDALVVGQQSALLLAEDFGIRLRDLTSGQVKHDFDYLFGMRDLIYYTLGSTRDGRLGAATGIVTWPHKIPDVTGLGLSSEEWADALSIQEQKLMLMDLEKGESLGSIFLNDSFIHTILFSADQRFVMTVSYLSVSFWDIRDPLNIQLSTKIDIKDFGVDQNQAQLIAAAAISSDLRQVVLSTDVGVMIVDTQQKKVGSILPWSARTGPRLIRYLVWSSDHASIVGSDLQGSLTVWSVTRSAVTLLKTYPLGSGSDGDVLWGASSGGPHAGFIVDPRLSFYIHPGQIIGDTFGQCQGFEVVPL